MGKSKMKNRNKEIEWYIEISKQNKVQPRCIYASIERCPRYFQSMKLLGDYNIITSINEKTIKKLNKKWPKSEFWSTIDEQSASIMGKTGEASIFSHFCPEIMYDVFGYFTSYLSYYCDELDMQNTHERLKAEKVNKDDYRWYYQSIYPMHYTECHLYSLLDNYRARTEEIFQLKPNIYGIGIDLKEIMRRFRKGK